MVDVMSVKVESQELLACRICLATDTQLYNVQETKLKETFLALMGRDVSWCGLSRACGLCVAQLQRAAALRARCRRTENILATALKQHRITIDYIRTIDRMAEKLCLNLKTYNVYSSDSTQQEVKLEDVKEESEDFTENIFISEPILDDTSYTDASEIKDSNTDQENCIKNNTNPKAEIKRRKTDSARRQRKLLKSTKEKLPTTAKETKKLPTRKLSEKRVIRRRAADNGFLPDFNFDEFESKYNVKIDILSREEQLREIEARKMSASFSLAAYGCELCGKAFATKQVYDAHIMKHDPAWGAHACGVCGVRFGSRSRAHVHADAHRLRFTCAQCGFLTRTRFIAKSHFLSHAGATHRCPHCDATFTKYTSYLTHVRRRHPAMNVACDECGETFVGRNGLRHHKTRVHRNPAFRKPSQYTCEKCGARFGSESDLSAHSSDGASGCRVADVKACGAGEGEGEGEEGRLCRECDATFVDGLSFDTHYQRVHLNVRGREPPRTRAPHAAHTPYICELCGQECSSVSRLRGHQRGHWGGGARPHACPAPGCARSFSTRHNMRRHHRVVHLGVRPLVACGVCGKQLAHAASLKLHLNTVHLKLPAPPRRRRRSEY